jgi:hypothetical protein
MCVSPGQIAFVPEGAPKLAQVGTRSIVFGENVAENTLVLTHECYPFL